jgi:hypothetical protein
MWEYGQELLHAEHDEGEIDLWQWLTSGTQHG